MGNLFLKDSLCEKIRFYSESIAGAGLAPSLPRYALRKSDSE